MKRSSGCLRSWLYRKAFRRSLAGGIADPRGSDGGWRRLLAAPFRTGGAELAEFLGLLEAVRGLAALPKSIFGFSIANRR